MEHTPNTLDRRVLLGAAGLAGFAALAVRGASGGRGPLDPPAGPVAGTGRTLDEVEARTPINTVNTPGGVDAVYRITAPGSYYLIGNVQGESGKHGIQIAASGVTLDLNGFCLSGTAGSLAGIDVSGSLSGVRIFNGSIRNWASFGLGIGAATHGVEVRSISAFDNASNGISAGDSCLVSNCTAFRNGATGIFAAVNAVVEFCSSYDNTLIGIQTQTGGVIRSCVARDNGTVGILGGEANLVEGCDAAANAGGGINASDGSCISCCTSSHNTMHGFRIGVGGQVRGCSAFTNSEHGILGNAGNLIVGNTCHANGQGAGLTFAGIRVDGHGSFIADNLCRGGSRGILANEDHNVIVRNVCCSNVINWVIGAGNTYGPILSRSGGAPAVSGNTAAGVTASTDPFTNLSIP